MPDCPTLAELEAFATGESTDRRLASHVGDCGDCREQVDQVRYNNDLMVELRASRSDGTVDGAGARGDGAPSMPGYEVETELHRGGQGVVYRARQLATHRTVALKVLLAGAFATSRQRRRFEREIELVAGLRHPNIVTVYDSGVTSEGGHWFAMEFLEGRTLDELIDDHGVAMAPRETLTLFGKICAAVAHAHQRGIIHRDLKPSNVIVDERGEPIVLDFGLAKTANADVAHAQATVTVEGGFLGTLAYASPEQTGGDPASLDVRSDVYSLGVILYEMLSGRFPYAVTGRLSDVIDAITRKPPMPLARPGLPRRIDEDIETIVRKALSKEPDRRYESAGALRRDIDRYLEGRPIDARRESGWYVFRKTLMRYKLPVAAAAAFVVLLAGSSIVAWFLYQQALAEKEKVTQINIFLEDTLGSAEPPGEGELTVGQMLDEGVYWIELALADQPEIEAAVRQIIGSAYRNVGRIEEAEAQLTASLKTRRSLFGPRHPEVARSLSALGLLRMAQQRDDEAERLFVEALAIRREALGPRDLAVAMALNNLGNVHRTRGDLDTALAFYEEAYTIRRDERGRRHADTAMCEFLMGEVLAGQQEYRAALQMHERALHTRQAVLHPRHPDLARSWEAIGRLYQALGEPDEAEPWFRRCLERHRAVLGDDHWRTRTTARALADLYDADDRPGKEP